MKPIPISAAESIAREYGYDQVVIVARKVDSEAARGGEHLTTFGITPAHCEVAFEELSERYRLEKRQ